MPSTTPLTDAINALTTYANETTGASDTTLSAAVGSLVAGYGGGGGSGWSADEIATRSMSGAITISTATSIAANAFADCTGITSLTDKTASLGGSCFSGCTNLAIVDYKPESHFCNGQRVFNNCAGLNTIILRTTTRKNLLYTNALDGTPFASGKAGGTVYICKALYDHLGDGSAYDFKEATGWKTIDGYGTITWAQIEGSQYENYYADGTPISS